MTNFFTENFRDLLIVGALIAGVGYATGATVPSVNIPEWWQLAAMGVAGAIGAGYFAGVRIYDLLPEPERVYLVALDSSENVKAAWALTPAQFERMEVVDGVLYPWEDSPERVYEVLAYDPEANVARANWRESVPESEILGKSEVSDALAQIAELRSSFEREARVGNAIRRRFAGILRTLDRKRAMDQNAAIEGHVAPSLDGESIDDVIQQHMPADLLPDHMTAGDQEDRDEVTGDVIGEGFDLLDDLDGEAIEPIGTNGNGDSHE